MRKGGLHTCIPADQTCVRKEVMAAPEESIQKAAVQDLPTLGLEQKRVKDGKPAPEGMCLSLWPSEIINEKILQVEV